MDNKRTSNEKQHPPGSAGKGKKLYRKPAFRYEQVFETLALSCCKVTGSSGQCQFSQKTS